MLKIIWELVDNVLMMITQYAKIGKLAVILLLVLPMNVFVMMINVLNI